MLLNVKERLLIVNAMPETGSLSEMRSIRKLAKVLVITEEETKDFDLKQDNGIITWNAQGDQGKEFLLNDEDLHLLDEIVNKWDEDKAINAQNIDLAERIKEMSNNN